VNIDAVNKMLADGMSMAEVARRLGVTRAAVSVALKRAQLYAAGFAASGLPRRPRGRPRKVPG
jgi:predicted DNA-binding protein YlxM (UPF0122 family)